jgi:hypothetical protein
MTATTDLDRVSKALAYLEDVLDDPQASRSEKLAAARSIIARSAREAANLSSASAKEDRVVRLEINTIPSQDEPSHR